MLAHSRINREVYERMLPEFEAAHGVRVDIQVMEVRALRERLNAALRTRAMVPDLMEISKNLAFFTQGPAEAIGFMDLTGWLEEEGEGVSKNFVQARSAGYSLGGIRPSIRGIAT